MNIRTSTLCLTLCLCAGGAFAQRAVAPQPRAPAHTPEFSHPTTGDPGTTDVRQLEIQRAVPADSVTEDLQRIVVLCATQPQSQTFETEWASYVRAHYRRGVDVDALIDNVLQRARAHRADAGESRRSAASIEVDSSATRRRMHDTAMAVIRKIG